MKNLNKDNDLMNHKRQLSEEFRGSVILELETTVQRVSTVSSVPVISLIHVKTESK